MSGIWPPDVGGPASHAPEVAETMRARGHEVEVVTTASAPPAPEPYAVHWVDRKYPVGLRHLLAANAIRRHAVRADVVYSTGMLVRTGLGARGARKPFVLKLTSDPVYERSLRYELTSGDLEAFQRNEGLRVRALRRTRDLTLARATHVVCPSESLRQLAIGWGLAPERVTLLPNPVPPPPRLAPREELRARFGIAGPTLVFAGRLSPQKSLEVTLDALRELDGVSLVAAGDGPLRAQIESLAEGLPVRFLGAQSREAVLELLAAGDVAVLSSSWENFPHMVVEALAVGTPVVATAVGGVTEILRDGENGVLVPPADPRALAAAIRRVLGDQELRARLAAAGPPSVERYAPERIYDELESILLAAAS